MPESIDIDMLEIPDQARNDRQRIFYDAINQLAGENVLGRDEQA
jgi:hypothetical protein